MSKLYKRAKVQYFLAEECFIHMADDDVFIDACCYSLQQAIELSLKFLVEMNGDFYAENHDLRSNLNKLNKLNVSIPMEKELRSMASTLYSWETDPRYNDDFVALLSDVKDARNIARTLITYCDELTSQKPIVPLSDYPDTRLGNS